MHFTGVWYTAEPIENCISIRTEATAMCFITREGHEVVLIAMIFLWFNIHDTKYFRADRLSKRYTENTILPLYSEKWETKQFSQCRQTQALNNEPEIISNISVYGLLNDILDILNTTHNLDYECQLMYHLSNHFPILLSITFFQLHTNINEVSMTTLNLTSHKYGPCGLITW